MEQTLHRVLQKIHVVRAERVSTLLVQELHRRQLLLVHEARAGLRVDVLSRKGKEVVQGFGAALVPHEEEGGEDEELELHGGLEGARLEVVRNHDLLEVCGAKTSL